MLYHYRRYRNYPFLRTYFCRKRPSVEGVFAAVVVGVAPVGVELPQLELVHQGASNQA